MSFEWLYFISVVCALRGNQAALSTDGVTLWTILLLMGVCMGDISPWIRHPIMKEKCNFSQGFHGYNIPYKWKIASAPHGFHGDVIPCKQKIANFPYGFRGCYCSSHPNRKWWNAGFTIGSCTMCVTVPSLWACAAVFTTCCYHMSSFSYPHPHYSHPLFSFTGYI